MTERATRKEKKGGERVIEVPEEINARITTQVHGHTHTARPLQQLKTKRTYKNTNA